MQAEQASESDPARQFLLKKIKSLGSARDRLRSASAELRALYVANAAVDAPCNLGAQWTSQSGRDSRERGSGECAAPRTKKRARELHLEKLVALQDDGGGRAHSPGSERASTTVLRGDALTFTIDAMRVPGCTVAMIDSAVSNKADAVERELFVVAEAFCVAEEQRLGACLEAIAAYNDNPTARRQAARIKASLAACKAYQESARSISAKSLASTPADSAAGDICCDATETVAAEKSASESFAHFSLAQSTVDDGYIEGDVFSE
jgi:hypothetical protein